MTFDFKGRAITIKQPHTKPLDSEITYMSYNINDYNPKYASSQMSAYSKNKNGLQKKGS